MFRIEKVPDQSAPTGRAERGAITILAAVIGVLLGLLAVVVAVLGNRVAAGVRLQSAADAVALAVAAEPPVGSQPNRHAGADIADRILARSGLAAASVSVRTQGDDVWVELAIDAPAGFGRTTRVQAQSQARRGRVERQGLAPVVQAAVARASQLAGEEILIVSGWRSRDAQQLLWDNRHANPYPVAAPGTSMHELGLAVDVPASQAATMAAVATEVGLCQPLPDTDPIHFVWCGPP